MNRKQFLFGLCVAVASFNLPCRAQFDDIPAEVGWLRILKGRPVSQYSKWKAELTQKLVKNLDLHTPKKQFVGKTVICHVRFGISKDGFVSSFHFEQKSDNKEFDSIIEKTFKSMSKEKVFQKSSKNDAVSLLTYIELSKGKYHVHHNDTDYNPRAPKNKLYWR
ncbi:MAG: TonB C-terminal domain-containing protein [Candidatus Melainabacteria bacterium]|nr:TonB C-terminal domain-containing protein [Candidatus Melainabacteria bacterium]